MDTMKEFRKAKVTTEKIATEYESMSGQEKIDQQVSLNPSAEVGRLLSEATSDEEELEILERFKLKVGTVEGDFAAMMAIFHSMNGNNWKNNMGWNGESSDWYGVKLNKKYRVIEVNLTKNKLSGRIPRSIHLLTKLKTFIVVDNPDLSGAIPPTMAQFRHLSKVDFTGSNLVMPSTGLPLLGHGTDTQLEGQKNIQAWQQDLLFTPRKPIVLRKASKLRHFSLSWNQCKVALVTQQNLKDMGICKGWVLNKIDGIRLSDLDARTARTTILKHRTPEEGDSNHCYHSLIILERLHRGPSVFDQVAHFRERVEGEEVIDYHSEKFHKDDSICLEFTAPAPWLFQGSKNDKYFPFDPFLAYKLEQFWRNTNQRTVVISKADTDVSKTVYEYDLTLLEQHRLNGEGARVISSTRKVKRAALAYIHPQREGIISNDKESTPVEKSKEETTFADSRPGEERTDAIEDVMDDIYEFDFLSEPMLPTKPIGSQGGLVGCDPSSFGVCLIAPPGAIPCGSELSLHRSQPEEKVLQPSEDSDDNDKATNVRYESMVKLELSGGTVEDPPALKSPLSMRLQHALVMDEANPFTSNKHLFVVSRQGSNDEWHRCIDSFVSDKYAEVTLGAGPIPTHVAIQSEQGPSEEAFSYHNTMAACVIVYRKSCSNEEVSDNNGLITIWVLPDRDDARQAVYQRMGRRNPIGCWNVIAESVEDLIVKKNETVTINVDGVVQERVFKPDQGACFHVMVQSDVNKGPYAQLGVVGFDGDIELYIPRPLPKHMLHVPPPTPELIHRADGGSMTIKLAAKKPQNERKQEEGSSMIVEIARLKVRDCADASGELLMPETVPRDAVWEVAYEGAMTVCMIEGGFACFIRSRFAEGGPWSPVLIVPPPGTNTLQATISPSVAGPQTLFNYQELQSIVSNCYRIALEVKDPNSGNCRLLAHRVACVLTALGAIPQMLAYQQQEAAPGSPGYKSIGSKLSEIVKKFREAQDLIQASACDGWLSRLLWPSRGSADVFISLDKQLFSVALEASQLNESLNVREMSGKVSASTAVKASSKKPNGAWYENSTENSVFQMQRQQLCSVLLRSSPPPLDDSCDGMVVNGTTMVAGDEQDRETASELYAKLLSVEMGFSHAIQGEEVSSIRFHEAYQRLFTAKDPFPIHKLTSSASTDLASPPSLCLGQSGNGSLSSASMLLSTSSIPCVFISYAKEDGDAVYQFAIKFAETIKASGIAIPILSFQDIENTDKLNKNRNSHGNKTSLTRKVAEAVQSCDIFFPIFSESYGKRSVSPFSSFELLTADQCLLPIIPISYSVYKPSYLFRIPTANLNIDIDFRDVAARSGSLFYDKMNKLCFMMSAASRECNNFIPTVDDAPLTIFDEGKVVSDVSVPLPSSSDQRSVSDSCPRGPIQLPPSQISHSVSEPITARESCKKRKETKTSKKEGEEDEEETLESWLSSLRLSRILPTLNTLGAEELEDLEYVEEEHMEVLGLRPIEKRKFEKAKQKLLIKLGVIEDAILSSNQTHPSLSPRPKVAKRIDIAIQKSVDSFEEKVWRAEVFGSMRFDACGPARRGGEAEQLKKALEDQGVKLHVVDISAGASITLTVFDIMERCHGFIAFGTKTYGANTGNPAATDREVAFWQGVIQQSQHEDSNGMTATAMAEARPLIPIRMISFDDRFDELAARVLFGVNALSIQWKLGTPMPSDIVPQILRSLRLSQLETPLKKLEYKDPTNPKVAAMFDEYLRKNSTLPKRKCLA